MEELEEDNLEKLNIETYGKLFIDMEYFIEESITENKELKKGFELFEEKIKQYENDHPNKNKRNEQIIEDLKTENQILK